MTWCLSRDLRRRRRTRTATPSQSSSRRRWAAWAFISYLFLPRKCPSIFCFHFLSLFVSSLFRKKQTIDKNLIKKFKAVQENELRTWRGVNVKFTSRPGNADSTTMPGGQCHTQGGGAGAAGSAGWVGNNAGGGMGMGGSMANGMGSGNGGLMSTQNC